MSLYSGAEVENVLEDYSIENINFVILIEDVWLGDS